MSDAEAPSGPPARAGRRPPVGGPNTVLHGYVEQGWGRVADAFRVNFEQGREIGAACAIYAGGRCVVDLWGGEADSRTGRPWEEDTVVVVRSTSKGATALCAHMLAERGEIDLDAPVAQYWPEFAAEGKEGILVRWVLSHQAGLPLVEGSLTLDEACAWDPVIRLLERQRPLWEPGTMHAYHGWTIGFLVGEIVRRVTGKTLGAFFAEEVARPLGMSSWIGLPARVEPRVAHVVFDAPAEPETAVARMGLDPEDAAAALAALQATCEPDSFQARLFALAGAFPQRLTEDGRFNAPIVRAAEFPSSNMVSDARSLARMYAATITDVDGVRLVKPHTVEVMTSVQTDSTKQYGLPAGPEALVEPMSMHVALGFMVPSRLKPLLGPRSFGHSGFGGSIGLADPDLGIGFGYVMNRGSVGGDPRVPDLLSAVAACAA